MVMVTARLVNPVNGADMPPLPGKESRDPNDVGVFLMNVFEESKMPKSSRRRDFQQRPSPRATLEPKHLPLNEDSSDIVVYKSHLRLN